MTARLLAALCLMETERGGYSNLVFKRAAQRYPLGETDTAFCAALFYRTLERQITIDHLLSGFLSRGIDKLDAEVRAVLRSGACQLFYMDGVPDYAAINESVKLCGQLRKSSASAFVNAVLKRLRAYDINSLRDYLDSPDGLSVFYSLNPLLCQLLSRQYGTSAEDIMRGFFAGEKQTIRVNTLKTHSGAVKEALKKEGIETAVTPIADCLAVESGNALKSSLFADGSLRVQSYGSQAAVQALSPRPGTRMIDLCSAPGGKALTAAELMGGRGEIIAVDRHSGRLRLLEERARIQGTGMISVREADCSVFMAEFERTADCVLADVPCSGYGKIGTKPELRQKAPESDGSLQKTQYAILSNSAGYLKPGGRLVYCTCTLDKRENSHPAKRFLAETNGEYRAVSDIAVPGFSVDEDGFLTLLPSDAGSEGFFIAVFERAD